MCDLIAVYVEVQVPNPDPLPLTPKLQVRNLIVGPPGTDVHLMILRNEGGVSVMRSASLMRAATEAQMVQHNMSPGGQVRPRHMTTLR